MPMLLVNREVGTQMWPSIQLPDDLGGVVEHVSVAWPGYPGCRHVQGSPQTSPSQHACCLLLRPVGGTWGAGTLDISKPEGGMVGHCVPEHAHRALAWAGVQSLRISDRGCFHCLCKDPWFSPSHSLSCCLGVGQSTHRVNTTSLLVVSLSALTSDQGVLGHQEAAGVSCCILSYYTRKWLLIYRFLLCRWPEGSSLFPVTSDLWLAGPHQYHLWTGYLIFMFLWA